MSNPFEEYLADNYPNASKEELEKLREIAAVQADLEYQAWREEGNYENSNKGL